MYNIWMLLIGVNFDGLNQEMVFIQQGSNGIIEWYSVCMFFVNNNQWVSIEVVFNICMMDSNGKIIFGNVDVYVVSYDYMNWIINKVVFVSLFVNNVCVKNGESLGQFNFVLVVVYFIDMYGVEGEVKQFDKLVKVQVEIFFGIFYFEIGVFIKIGDELEVWSFNESIGDWQEEGWVFVISENGGKFIVEFEQIYLFIWFFGGCFFCNLLIWFLIENVNQLQ